MIHLSSISFSYGRGDFSLHIDDFSVARGESVAIIGPSGTGKTTLLNLIAGILPVDAGNVDVDGTSLPTLSDKRVREFRIRRMGLVFQEFELVPHLSVLDNITLPYRISAALQLSPETRERARSIAGEVGLGGKILRNVRRLSQGERQRVAVCRALLPKPDILLTDEPTGNLDPKSKTRVLDLLFDYAKQNQATLLTVTHDQSILNSFDRTVDSAAFHD